MNTDSGERSAGPDRLEERILMVCDAVGSVIEGWGFRSIHGRVWALLAVSGRALPSHEIADRLGVSRALVSLAMAELKSYGLVKSTSEARNAPYAAQMDIWPVITDVLREREWMLLERARLALESALAEAKAAQDPQLSVDIHRLESLLSLTDAAQSALRAILRVRMPTALDHAKPWLKRAQRRMQSLSRHLG